jgi:hypothetical protein
VPKTVGQVAEEERAHGRARDVERAADRDLVLADPERVLLGQPGRDRADDRDLEPVEDPHRSEPEHDEPVPAAPGQPVHARGDARLDGLWHGADLPGTTADETSADVT